MTCIIASQASDRRTSAWRRCWRSASGRLAGTAKIDLARMLPMVVRPAPDRLDLNQDAKDDLPLPRRRAASPPLLPASPRRLPIMQPAHPPALIYVTGGARTGQLIK